MEYPISNILEAGFPYYRRLSNNSKEKFLKRVTKFIKSKEFEGRGGLEITGTIKVLISATAIQLTFGLEKYLMKHFHKILIYPDQFYSPYSKSKNVGEVNTAGIIVLSWKAFEEGLKDLNDSYNVALHEMAHALNLTDLMDKDIDPVFSAYFDKFYVVARKVLSNVDGLERNFFRKYAARNLQEFFAVVVENFFENSKDFKGQLPDLYKHFVCLLNQDPLNPDYKINFKDDYLSGSEIEIGNPIQIIKPAKSKKTKIFEIVAPLIAFSTIFFFSKEYTIMIIATISLIVGLTSIRKRLQIELYKETFLVKYAGKIFKRDKRFTYKDIISVNYYEPDEGSPEIIVNTYFQGKVVPYSFVVYTNFESFKPLFKYLFEVKLIAVKERGQIFIPQ